MDRKMPQKRRGRQKKLIFLGKNDERRPEIEAKH